MFKNISFNRAIVSTKINACSQAFKINEGPSNDPLNEGLCPGLGGRDPPRIVGVAVFGRPERPDQLALEALATGNPVLSGRDGGGHGGEAHGPGQGSVHLLTLEVLLERVDVDLEVGSG